MRIRGLGLLQSDNSELYSGWGTLDICLFVISGDGYNLRNLLVAFQWHENQGQKSYDFVTPSLV